MWCGQAGRFDLNWLLLSRNWGEASAQNYSLMKQFHAVHLTTSQFKQLATLRRSFWFWRVPSLWLPSTFAAYDVWAHPQCKDGRMCKMIPTYIHLSCTDSRRTACMHPECAAFPSLEIYWRTHFVKEPVDMTWSDEVVGIFRHWNEERCFSPLDSIHKWLHSQSVSARHVVAKIHHSYPPMIETNRMLCSHYFHEVNLNCSLKMHHHKCWFETDYYQFGKVPQMASTGPMRLVDHCIMDG